VETPSTPDREVAADIGRADRMSTDAGRTAEQHPAMELSIYRTSLIHREVRAAVVSLGF
jgi:hypothetical protein